MLLMLYDIEAKKDPHGIRIRLVRRLRRYGAFQLQKSAWLLEALNDDIVRVIDEFRAAGGSVKFMEWLPRTMGEAAGMAPKTIGYALVVLGAEPILEGWHKKVLSVLQGLGARVVVLPAGESATQAYLKAGSIRRPYSMESKSISRALDEAMLRDVDGIVLLNSGRSAQSGIVFGAQTVANTKLLGKMTSLPLVQVESPGKDDGVIVVWNDSGKGLANSISKGLGITVITPSPEAKMVTIEGGREVRQIHYARLGDSIIVNGTRVGVCLTDQVYLVAEDGRLIDIMGGKIDRRAAKNLAFDSISRAVVKSLGRGGKEEGLGSAVKGERAASSAGGKFRNLGDN